MPLEGFVTVRRFSRRSLLVTTGLGAAGLFAGNFAFPPPAIAAPAATDRLFVFAYFEGGWDLLLSTDPRDPRTHDPSVTQIDLGWETLGGRYATMGWNGPGTGNGVVFVPNPVPGGVERFGPAIGGMRRHHAEMCLVNGINMETLTHEVGRRLFLTGRQPLGLTAQGSATPTLIAAQQGPLSLVPNLSFRVETYAEQQPAYAAGLKVASVEDLSRALAVGRITPSADVLARIDAARTAGGCTRRQVGEDRTRLFEESRTRARQLTAARLERHFDFLATESSNPRGLAAGELAEMAALRSRYRINDLTGAEAQAALAFQSLRLGIAQCVSVMLADGLDTHGGEWKAEQPRRLERGFDALAVLIDDLKASGLWSRTTLLAWSEFGRSAQRNSRDGRDHSLCNSAILMGAGIRPGRLIGASAEGLRPLRVDFSNGRPDEVNGSSISAKNVLSTVFRAAGLDDQHLRAGPIPAALA